VISGGATTYVGSKENSGDKDEKAKGYGYRIAKAKVGEIIRGGRGSGGGDGSGGHLGLKRNWESIWGVREEKGMGIRVDFFGGKVGGYSSCCI